MFSRNPAFNHPVYQEGQAVAPADWRGIAADQMAASKSGRAAQRRDAGLMTLSGTLGKTSFLLGLCMASGAATFAVIEREMISARLGDAADVGLARRRRHLRPDHRLQAQDRALPLARSTRWSKASSSA
jgi:hypothetical protein